jgi:hypothetical protein
MESTQARFVTVLLGAWLLVTAFLWHHSRAQFLNSLLMAIIVIVSSLIAIGAPRFRFVTAAAGVWLVCSFFAWQDQAPATSWNNVLVGGAIALASAFGPDEAERTA